MYPYPSMEPSNNNVFDFDTHRWVATNEYRRVRHLYEQFAEVSQHILSEALATRAVAIHSVEARAKDVESFGKKVSKPLESNPERPKYREPLSEITDLTGVRVITYFPSTIDVVDHCIQSEFEVIEKTDRSQDLTEEGKFGYLSIHYLVKMKSTRTSLPEYSRFTGMTAEVQLRTILQHAWAEMEHDIQYKSVAVIPMSIRRRFMALAGMLEIADREFQAIQNEDERLRAAARVSVQEGKLDQVEITPDALKSYLDKRFGPDGRMTSFSYEFVARMLQQMGFRNFAQIDECISGYDDDLISRIVWGGRQGQIARFEDTLLAGMGENFTNLHKWSSEPWFVDRNSRILARLELADIKTSEYAPPKE